MISEKLITKEEAKVLSKTIKILKKWRGKECVREGMGCFICDLTAVIKRLEQLREM